MRAKRQRAVIRRQRHHGLTSISLAVGAAALMLAACGPTPWAGERGVLVVRVRDGLGVPVGGLDCELVPDDMRASVEELYLTDEQGACTFRRAPAMGLTVIISSTFTDPPSEVARVRATVRSGTISEIVVVLDPAP